MQFIDASGEYKFQVSAWPYTQLDLTLGRFGEPSATSDQPDHLEIVDVVRDDTFTVLFQKNGIRYAVVTLPEHENCISLAVAETVSSSSLIPSLPPFKRYGFCKIS